MFYDTFASPTIGTHVFYDTFASPTIRTYVFYDTFACPTIGTYVFYDTFKLLNSKNEWKHRDCCIFSYLFSNFTENKLGMQTHFVRFFDPSLLKRSLFLKSAHLAPGTGDNRRQPAATAATAAP